MKYPSLLAAIIVLIILIPERADAQIGWTKSYENAVVVTAEERASNVGKEILQQGGNAVDAAVAVQFALAVTLPRAGNIGGGGFMVIHKPDGTGTTLDYREQAPGRAGPDMYIRDGEYQSDLSRNGALASGVPGVVDGMIKALDEHGTMSLREVLQPAIQLAREGYSLSWIQAATLNGYKEALLSFDGSRTYFTKADGSDFSEGDLFVQDELAQTLERIAENGRNGFYAGETADMIVETMNKYGGLISHEDLQNYESKWRDPVAVDFRGYRLSIMPPPSSGSIAIAQMLKMLQPFDLKAMGYNSIDYVHTVTEAMRRAFADRAHFLGDPDFVDIPRDTLLSDSYNRNRMQSFDVTQASSSDDVGHGDVPGFMESTETTHFSIVDKDGNAVAVTTTLNGSFGSKLAVEGAGFMLNNEMDDFTAKPGEPNMFGLIQGKANAIEPGKRMLSSMSPTIVTKGDSVRMVIGAAGGPRIISATLQNFLNLAVFEMNAQEAVSAPRIHHQWLPDEIRYEEFGISYDTRAFLEDMGHNLTTGSVGRAHIIYVDENGMRHGAPDPRGDGKAEGY